MYGHSPVQSTIHYPVEVAQGQAPWWNDGLERPQELCQTQRSFPFEEGAMHNKETAMKRVLLTGMSGTGKSTVINELAARGYTAVDADSEEFSQWARVTDSDRDKYGGNANSEWIWREDAIRELLEAEDSSLLFLAGCASNQGKFYPYFEHIILLSAPTDLIVERLETRTNNYYGKDPAELADVLTYINTVEPLLRRGATMEIDTSAPLSDVVDSILEEVGA